MLCGVLFCPDCQARGHQYGRDCACPFENDAPITEKHREWTLLVDSEVKMRPRRTPTCTTDMTTAVKKEEVSDAWDALQLCLATGSAVVEDEAPQYTRATSLRNSLRRLGGVKRRKLDDYFGDSAEMLAAAKRQ